VNGDEVRNITFGRGFGGYDAAQVNDLLDRIAAELAAGRPAAPLIAAAAFQARRGYDAKAVDWFLEQLRRREDSAEAERANADPWRDLAADPYCIRREPGDLAGRIAAPSVQECAGAWRDFEQQPGTRLSWVATGALSRELRTAEQQTMAAVRSGMSATLTAGGRTCTRRGVSRSSWPGIAETISDDRPGAPAHMLNRQAGKRDPALKQLLDETGMPVLYTAGQHFERKAGGYIKFPGQRWLRFPVRGARRANVIMTAVDQAGNKVARYRLVPNRTGFRETVEITVHPGQRLTDELTLAIALSAPWLRSYFGSSGGG
jgi:DivIVA domain-containing protein